MPVYNPPVVAVNTKVVSFTRDLTTASGTAAVTGFGFSPKFLFIMGGKTVSYTGALSIGFCDENLTEECIRWIHADDTPSIDPGAVCESYNASGHGQYANVQSLDSDGFTLNWTKQGTPTETATFYALGIG